MALLVRNPPESVDEAERTPLDLPIVRKLGAEQELGAKAVGLPPLQNHNFQRWIEVRDAVQSLKLRKTPPVRFRNLHYREPR